MGAKDYLEFVKNQVVEGFENGYKFDDFKKGDKVGVFWSFAPAQEDKFMEGKVIKVERALNATGKDTIRNIEVDLGKTIFSVHGHTQIKYFLFKKVAEEIVEAAPVEEAIEGETMIVEKAMSVKNPTVKKYLAEGWKFVGKEWNAEKNMYLATLVREGKTA